MKLWAKTETHSEGRYLVVRRDGTVPAWPHFVMGARDPFAAETLRAYADITSEGGADQEYVNSILDLANDFDAYRTREGNGDPEAPPHRKDDPATLEAMRGNRSTISVVPDKSPPDLSFEKTKEVSSNVGGIAMDSAGHLYVRFKDQSVYRWEKKAAEHFAALRDAPSPGKYIHAHLPKGKRVPGL